METLREKIGQMVMVGCRDQCLSREEQLILGEYQFGGFILFRRNCSSARQIRMLCGELWESAAEAPPLIAIDEEGGRVHRLPPPFTHFPAAAAIGACGDAALAYRAGKACAVELALVGINLNFAPVLDVDSNPANPIIGDRAFGTDPQTVITAALPWSCGLREAGVIPCAKHFPGHGDTDTDSHFECPVVRKSWDDLHRIELAPFAAACDAGIEALMTAHVQFPALDANHVATLSEPIVTGLLRHQLGYDGVVFSDDMAMKAVSDRYDSGEAALLALSAGVDVMLFCHDLEQATQAVETLCAAAEREPALRANVEASCRRIGALKQRRLRNFTGVPEGEVEIRLEQLAHSRLLAEIHGSL